MRIAGRIVERDPRTGRAHIGVDPVRQQRLRRDLIGHQAGDLLPGGPEQRLEPIGSLRPVLPDLVADDDEEAVRTLGRLDGGEPAAQDAVADIIHVPQLAGDRVEHLHRLGDPEGRRERVEVAFAQEEEAVDLRCQHRRGREIAAQHLAGIAEPGIPAADQCRVPGMLENLPGMRKQTDVLHRSQQADAGRQLGQRRLQRPIDADQRPHLDVQDVGVLRKVRDGRMTEMYEPLGETLVINEKVTGTVAGVA